MKVHNTSAGLQPLKKNPEDLHSNKGSLSFRGGCDGLTWWCAGVLRSSVSGMLCIPAGIWKQDASLSPVSRVRNARRPQVFAAWSHTDNFYFTLTCELGRDLHQQLCFRRRKASPRPCMGMFNIPAHVMSPRNLYVNKHGAKKLRLRILFPIFINSLQQ